MLKIALAGGGSGGPVAPLLAVAQNIKKNAPNSRFFLIGTKRGPEKIMAQKTGISFYYVPAGKLRRYFSWLNILTPFLVMAGFIKSIYILKKTKPDCIFAAGSFVQVPVVWAGWLLRIPSVIHQQDYMPSLANTLCQYAAKNITVSFEDSIKDFGSNLGIFYKKGREKIFYTGNPFREGLKEEDREKSLKFFGLKNDLPTLLVLGGGTGSQFLNDLILESLPKLAKIVQIIHLTGRNKKTEDLAPNYKQFEFINYMGKAYAASDIVLCRAGLSTITELSNLRKTAIIVPMPQSHQEINAYYLLKKDAAIVVTQKRLNEVNLTHIIKKILFDNELNQKLQKNISLIMPKNSSEKIAEIILKNINESKRNI